MWLNYPNNPTSATADIEYFERVVDFAKAYDIAVCHDGPYTEVAYDGYVPPSFLQARGAMDVAVEFHSLSKSYNMTGWRVGMAVGNAEMINALMRVKSNLDSGHSAGHPDSGHRGAPGVAGVHRREQRHIPAPPR